MKTISYGVLIVDQHRRLLLAHVTGQKHWDIPKGGADAGETPVAAAVRELREETGIEIDPARLTDLGPMRYMPRKDLHLFHVSVVDVDIDLAACVCTSFFPHHRTGMATPEVDGFCWADPESVGALCTRAMATAIAACRTLPTA